jgi:cobalt-zinc-cadmium efflux system protein
VSGHAHGAGNERRLGTALGLTLAVALVELSGGFVSHSLALLSDSAHVFMDALALGVSVFAARAMRRPANQRRTYGYARFEILAALLNGFLLFGVTVAIAIEAIRRFAVPEAPQGASMAAFAAVGLAINVAIGIGLARNAGHDMNVRAALLHVAGDVVGAVAVLLGGLAVLATHAVWIDPAVSLGVAALIVAGVVRIVREATDVLLQSAPENARIPVVLERMRAQPGVVDVHDLHVWSLGSDDHVLTAHVLLADTRLSEASAVQRDLQAMLHDEFGIGHVTLQFECDTCGEDGRIAAVFGEAGPPASKRRT